MAVVAAFPAPPMMPSSYSMDWEIFQSPADNVPPFGDIPPPPFRAGRYVLWQYSECGVSFHALTL